MKKMQSVAETLKKEKHYSETTATVYKISKWTSPMDYLLKHYFSYNFKT